MTAAYGCPRQCWMRCHSWRMKKVSTLASCVLGLCLLGNIAPAKAEVIYLTCTLNQRSLFKGLRWSDWSPFPRGGSKILKFTLSEDNQSGSVLDEDTSQVTKLPFVTFQPETILAKNSGGLGVSNVYGDPTDTYSISRTDGSVIQKSVIIAGSMEIKAAGQCVKSKPKQTLF